MKILKHGKFFKKTYQPPAGLQATCFRCDAKMSTGSNERKAEPFSQEYTGGRLKFKQAWNIPCPECGYGVHFIENRAPYAC